jgi:hypothetical protein
MKSIAVSRRGALGGIATLAAGVVTAAARPAAAANACGGLTREEFLEYVTLFNANDPRFIQFYHDDVVFELNNATVIKGPQAIREFYGPVKEKIHEKVEVAAFVSDATGIAAELPTEFRVYKDWENGFFQRPLKAGQVMRTISFGFYEVKDRKFRHIRAVRYKQIHDWRMETA